MNFTCLSLTNAAMNSQSPINKQRYYWLLFCLLSLLPPAALSDALVTRVEGEIMIKPPGDTTTMRLVPGALLPEHVETTAESPDARYWVLCPDSDKSHPALTQAGLYRPCPKQENRNMRGAEKENLPFILLPNQPKLEKLDRILWSGPKDNEYAILLLKYDADGFEEPVKEWLPEGNTYKKNGIHEFIPDTPLRLAFTENNGVTYKLEIENLDTSQSSSTFDDILIKPITSAPSPALMTQGYKLLEEQEIERHSDLGKLIIATYFLDNGQRAEAYNLLSELRNSQYRAQAQLLKATALYQPGAPTDIIIKQYGKALEFSIAADDALSSFIACRGIYSPSPLLLSSEGKEYQKHISNKAEFAHHCQKP